MLFVKIEDSSGSIETLIFPSLYKQNPPLWQEDKIVLVQGRLSDKDGEVKVLCRIAWEITPENIQQVIRQSGQQPNNYHPY